MSLLDNSIFDRKRELGLMTNRVPRVRMLNVWIDNLRMSQLLEKLDNGIVWTLNPDHCTIFNGARTFSMPTSKRTLSPPIANRLLSPTGWDDPSKKKSLVPIWFPPFATSTARILKSKSFYWVLSLGSLRSHTTNQRTDWTRNRRRIARAPPCSL